MSTNRRVGWVTAALVVFGLVGRVAAQEAAGVSVASAPPVVVKTVPQAGMEGVDPAVTEITVTYSKDMAEGSWSWSTLSPESFPETTGKPTYRDDKRTCVLPVKLKPNTTYAVWLNSATFTNFKDAGGKPAVPYLLVFKTKS